MQTLGLSGETRRSDGALKSLFWPTVDNAWDVDYLGRQGLTICTAVAVIELVMGLLTGSAVYAIIGAAAALIFVIGGMGVREGSWPAAATVFSLYTGGLLAQVVAGRLPGILALIVEGVLLSNLRATFLASRWKPAAVDEDKPTRFNETLADFLADQLPAKAWPVLRYLFFAGAALFLLLILVSIAAIALKQFGLIGRVRP
jgi:hypothetical protein